MDLMIDHAIQRTHERFQRHQERAIKASGYGATAGALGIANHYHSQLSAYIAKELVTSRAAFRNAKTDGFLRVIRQLSPELIGLCSLQTALHSVACADQALRTCLALGRAISSECWAAKLLEHDGKLAAKIERAVRRRHASVEYRKQAARSAAARAGFRMRHWSEQQSLLAGNVLLTLILEALPEVFVLEVDDQGIQYLTLTPNADELALDAVDAAIAAKPVFLPCTEPPRPWTGWSRGGYPNDARRSHTDTLLRTHMKETEASVKAAIKDGSLQPFLDALNALQAVPYKINPYVLGVMQDFMARGITVKGMPQTEDLELPPRDKEWEDMSDDEQRAWKYRSGQVKQGNRGLVSERLQFSEDISTATLLDGHAKFWTPCNADWRGRVYPMSHFNFQRDDRVRALFLFAEGVPIGEEGLYWLKVHVANCGDFDKISKRPFDERVAWTDQWLTTIKHIVKYPYGCLEYLKKADKPFLFLAACMELVSAISTGPTYVTYLPISFDGSCSGLQHLSAMTRAPEGSLVNLTSASEPQDVYQTVAERVQERIAADVDVFETSEWARMYLAYGITRKLVKRNVMTFAYSSKKFGMGEQHMEDLMRPISLKVLKGDLTEHPFASPADTRVDKDGKTIKRPDGASASKYLAGHVYDAIKDIVTLPALAMGFLQSLAKALAHEGKPLSWVTPTGLPWCNRYHHLEVQTMTLWLQDARVRTNLAVGHSKTIDKEKSANSVAPNFVHALDASHLMLTAIAAAGEGVQIATVHDSFGCLAPHAARFRDIIREQFVRMYETHDVLAEVFDAASRDLTLSNSHRLPERLQYGSLDIRQVLNAPFAFA